MNEREAVFQRRAARLIRIGTPVYPLGISDGTAMPWERHSRAVELQRQTGGTVVHGWIVDQVAAVSQARIALFHFHSVVLAPGGGFFDPSHLKNAAPRFLPDPDRAFDAGRHLTWNSIAVASAKITCPITFREFPAMKPLWVTTISGRAVFSMNPLHARRRMVPDGEDCTAYVAGLGLDPTSIVDVSFATNLEFSLVAYVGRPASRARGPRLVDAVTQPPAVVPAPPPAFLDGKTPALAAQRHAECAPMTEPPQVSDPRGGKRSPVAA
jgi:hypothetical protein